MFYTHRFVCFLEMGGTYSTGGVFVVKEKEKGSNKRHRRKDNTKKPTYDDRFEWVHFIHKNVYFF